MKVKKYVVKNMNEAMAKIRNELGKDAIIVSQRKVRKEGIKGYFTPKMIEVTAALDRYNKDNEKKQSMDSIKALIYNKQEEQKRALISEKQIDKKDKIIENTDSANENIIKEVIEMKNMIKELQSNRMETKDENDIDSFIDSLDISKESKKRIIEEILKIDSDNDIEEKFKISLEKIVPEYEDKERKIEILIGPTGVGKTTTIAKLAGRKALLEKKKVGLITIDTYRIGAVEQLKTYSEIMNIPFKVVYSIKEMDEALEELKDCDSIFIDTTGRSAKNTMQISELRAYINKIPNKLIHLVISSTIKNKDIKVILQGYGVIDFDSIIVTKLDETSNYEILIDALIDGNKPISYMTLGQSVPDDIKKVSKNFIIDLIVGDKVI
ncbi:flagellar biosynthesis protein FlhF [Clostridium bornimense]|uniref:flagellar biosynthesis protein FlhF n=1 Tax=Clostridium bornimense TaxID=1216932 RepID=UPI001C126A7A|nr:flagellar biosynthesis protein FlhF [Clostridium bornimense]MBU5314754.1 flagellar biosynthesis protein FlhF [Clostridium bornimense]